MIFKYIIEYHCPLKSFNRLVASLVEILFLDFSLITSHCRYILYKELVPHLEGHHHIYFRRSTKFNILCDYFWKL